MPETLSNVHEFATERTNDPGNRTPILEFSPTEGLLLELYNDTPLGSTVGVPVYMDLRDPNDDPLPQDTEIAFQFEAPGFSDPETVSNVQKNIGVWNRTSIKEQQSDEYIDQFKIQLNSAAVRVRHIDKLYVSILTDTEIDWSNSTFYVDEQAAEEVGGA